MSRLDDYRELVPKGTVDFLKRLAEQVKGKKILNINSTKLGGGVAEMLRSHIPLLQDVGVEAEWQTISGTEEFFNVTKSFPNAPNFFRD
jgi:trehalose synthase